LEKAAGGAGGNSRLTAIESLSESKRVKAFLIIIRPVNCVLMGFAVLIGEIIAVGGGLLLLPSLLGFITAFALTASSMVMNDVYDSKVDAVNEPKRPIPSGLIKLDEARWYATFFCTLGLVAALFNDFLITFFCLPVAIFSFALSIYYSARGKKSGFWGNLMVSGCVAVPFIYGSFIVGMLPRALLLIFALLAFVSNVGREIIKGISDVEGDKIRNVKSLALMFGAGKAAVIAAFFYFLAVAFSVIPIIFNLVFFWYLPWIMVTDLGFVSSGIFIIINHSAKNAKKIKNISLVWMLTGLMSFVLGGTKIF
jgi:geranylgeranylglycerol-phosphate geranylgeranyltransferase